MLAPCNISRVLILGEGLIGQALLTDLLQAKVSVVCASRQPSCSSVIEVDLCNRAATKSLISWYKPSIVINCVGLAGFVRCQEKPDQSLNLNVRLSNGLVDLAVEQNFKYVFISSSYIFEGNSGMHVESERPNPNSVYGQHKVLAESYIQAKLKNFLILRLDTVFSLDVESGRARVGGGLIGSLIRLVPRTLLRTPISIKAVGEVGRQLVLGSMTGIYHVAGGTLIDLRMFYWTLNRELGITSEFEYIKREEIRVMPPRNSSLSTAKIAEIGVKVPDYRTGWLKDWL